MGTVVKPRKREVGNSDCQAVKKQSETSATDWSISGPFGLAVLDSSEVFLIRKERRLWPKFLRSLMRFPEGKMKEV
jgi:hypothetical protein